MEDGKRNDIKRRKTLALSGWRDMPLNNKVMPYK